MGIMITMMKNLNTSLPAWGEWIEIEIADKFTRNEISLSPHGESGLKFQ